MVYDYIQWIYTPFDAEGDPMRSAHQEILKEMHEMGTISLMCYGYITVFWLLR